MIISEHRTKKAALAAKRGNPNYDVRHVVKDTAGIKGDWYQVIDMGVSLRGERGAYK